MVYDALSAEVRSAVGGKFPVPIKRLVGFDRVTLAPGASRTISITLAPGALDLTTADGTKQSFPGPHNLVFSRGNGVDSTVTVTVPAVNKAGGR